MTSNPCSFCSGETDEFGDCLSASCEAAGTGALSPRPSAPPAYVRKVIIEPDVLPVVLCLDMQSGEVWAERSPRAALRELRRRDARRAESREESDGIVATLVEWRGFPESFTPPE